MACYRDSLTFFFTHESDKSARIILKWNINKMAVRIYIGFMWLRIGPSGKLL
jgi:hypothetical protein